MEIGTILYLVVLAISYDGDRYDIQDTSLQCLEALQCIVDRRSPRQAFVVVIANAFDEAKIK